MPPNELSREQKTYGGGRNERRAGRAQRTGAGLDAGLAKVVPESRGLQARDHAKPDWEIFHTLGFPEYYGQLWTVRYLGTLLEYLLQP